MNIVKNFLNGDQLFTLNFSLKGYTHYNNNDDYYEIKYIIYDDILQCDITYVLRATKPLEFDAIKI